MLYVDLHAARARQLKLLREAEQAQLLRRVRKQRYAKRYRLRHDVADLLVELAEQLRERDEPAGRAVGRGEPVGSH